MIITPSMNVEELNARTQNALTADQARKLRDLLNETEHENTEDIPEGEWLQMVEEAAQ